MAQNNKPKIERANPYDKAVAEELKAGILNLFDKKERKYEVFMKSLAEDNNKIYERTKSILKQVKEISESTKIMLEESRRNMKITTMLSWAAIIISAISLIIYLL